MGCASSRSRWLCSFTSPRRSVRKAASRLRRRIGTRACLHFSAAAISACGSFSSSAALFSAGPSHAIIYSATPALRCAVTIFGGSPAWSRPISSTSPFAPSPSCFMAIFRYGKYFPTSRQAPFTCTALSSGHAKVVNPVAWTLEMEVQFYLLVPLLTLIFLVRNRWLRRTALAAISPSQYRRCRMPSSPAGSAATLISGQPSAGCCNTSLPACCSAISTSPRCPHGGRHGYGTW